MFLWAIYIFPVSVCLFCYRKIGGPIVWIYKRSKTHECWKWDWGRTIPFLGTHKSKFLCSVATDPYNMFLWWHELRVWNLHQNLWVKYGGGQEGSWSLLFINPCSMIKTHVVQSYLTQLKSSSDAKWGPFRAAKYDHCKQRWISQNYVICIDENCTLQSFLVDKDHYNWWHM